MSDSLQVTPWCIVIGGLLIAMTLASSFIARLPLSAAMLYLAVGAIIGPNGLGLLRVDPILDAPLLERLTEVALLISLFNAGFKLDLPFGDPRWRVPLRLATVSMLLTVLAVAAAGVVWLHLPLGAAVLLGAVLAPTDPVLASDVQVENVGDRDRLRFGLTGEGGLNDGSAFPLVLLGLGLLGLHPLGAHYLRWWLLDVLWAVSGGLLIGYAAGYAVGRAVLYLRARQREAAAADEFIAFGLIALAYGLALGCNTYGFLAVFAAGLALRRVEKRTTAVAPTAAAGAPAAAEPPAVEPPAQALRTVRSFNLQLESFAEVGIVLTVGALLARVEFDSATLWFVPLLFLVIRPLAVMASLAGVPIGRSQRALMAWFGIRGIGSFYYLLYAIDHRIDPALAERLLSISVAVVVASVLAHGVSVTPLMRRYEKRRRAAASADRGQGQIGDQQDPQ